MHDHSSSSVQLLYQDEPSYCKKSAHKLKGWTETLLGYFNEAEKLVQLLLRNRALMNRSYTWEVSINVEAVLSPAEITALWKKVCRKLDSRKVRGSRPRTSQTRRSWKCPRTMTRTMMAMTTMTTTGSHFVL